MIQVSYIGIAFAAFAVSAIVVLTILAVTQYFKIKNLQKLADLDPLTDIPNRRTFHKMFHSLVSMLPVAHESSRKSANLSSLTLFALDMRNFKEVNDSFGHSVGDQLLRDVTETLQGMLREGDIFGRIGGDEFLIALPNVRFEEAQTIAERCVEEVEAIGHSGLYSAELKISITIGAVAVVGRPHDPSHLVQAADEALYEAKRAGVSVVVNHYNLED